ncbi:MAG: IS110 family transposase [Methylovirgula sp.]
MNSSTIGVDVSKDWLDAHRLADGDDRRFGNDKAGRRALIKWLSAMPVKLVVFEPTDPYHRALERSLDAAGLPIAKVNPRQARRFAEAADKRKEYHREGEFARHSTLEPPCVFSELLT